MMASVSERLAFALLTSLSLEQDVELPLPI